MEIAEQKKQLPLPLIVLMMLSAGLAYFFSNFHRFSLGVVSSILVTELQLDPAMLGLLGSGFFYSYGLMQTPCGILSDKVSPRLILFLSCLLAAVSTLWFSVAGGFAGLFVSRTLTGFAVAFVYLSAMAVIREWFDEKIFGTMNGILIAMGQLGSVCTSVPLLLAINQWGWRGTFRALAYVSMVLCIVVWFSVRSRGRSKKSGLKPPVWQSTKKTFKNPGFWSVIFFSLVVSGPRLSFQGLWGARFYGSVLEKGDEKAVLLMTISIGCIVGAMLLGWMADRFGHFRVLAGTGFIMALIWFFYAFIDSSTHRIVPYVLNFILGVLGVGGYTVSISSVLFFSSGSNGGFLAGINGSSGFLGSAVFTQLVGIFFSVSGFEERTGYRIMFVVFGVLCIVITLWLMLSNRNAKKNVSFQN